MLNLSLILTIKTFNNNFIGYAIDYVHTNYSFIKIQNNNVTQIEEKNKISKSLLNLTAI